MCTTRNRTQALGVVLSTLWLFVLLLPGGAAAVELRKFTSEDERARFNGLVAELRCTVCQNQSLADSDAELARDMRQRVHELLSDGQTDDEIIAYMVDRYTSFIRYRPPFNAATAALWVGPFILFAGGLWFLFLQIGKHRGEAQARGGALSADEREQLAALLHGQQKDES